MRNAGKNSLLTGDIGFVVLLLIHLGSVISWLGSAVVMVYVVSPNLPKGEQSTISMLPRFGKLIRISSLTTLLAGLFLFGYAGSFDASHLPTGLGLLLLLSGAVLGLVAFIVANVIVLPSSKKFLVADRESNIIGMRAKQADAIRGGSRGVLVLLVLALILMVSGTYI